MKDLWVPIITGAVIIVMFLGIIIDRIKAKKLENKRKNAREKLKDIKEC
jgi:hypothetical protein